MGEAKRRAAARRRLREAMAQAQEAGTHDKVSAACAELAKSCDGMSGYELTAVLAVLTRVIVQRGTQSGGDQAGVRMLVAAGYSLGTQWAEMAAERDEKGHG